ncbi:molybdenum cofactor guanylyltransferase [Pseudoxanthomonas daejeonensis]|uniref:Molybdopterin-guanine dinucleotide biosynthesis protein MobA n=1 Tax=Pseudoxanthomonas daejeonensis TaxID=266062 RepID=A0ABQ6Z5I9_9GAMM|nr:molybdenum cofactor guanylyltransferase [Pseudoxanthomonas daejeonensis]KAF1693022.1 molybdopterin-guanine dinucleotide biosynthesis protein MobA [Pseudoxanthomonas daejeonensis]
MTAVRAAQTPVNGLPTLGLLAGGRGTRLGGVDKAWLVRDGLPQVLRFARRFPGETGPVLVSANGDLQRYAEAGLQAVVDRLDPGSGPLAGIDALAAACSTEWLLILPVDLFDVNDCLLRTLASGATGNGALAEDDDGLQPLVALYRCEALRRELPAMIAEGDLAPRNLARRLGLSRVRLTGVRFGNLNTPRDLATACMELPRPSGDPTGPE